MGDQVIAGIIAGELGKHLAVFIDRIIIWLEFGGTDDDFQIQDVTVGNQIGLLHFMVQVAQMPKDEL